MASNSWDFDCFPLDLSEKFKLATTTPLLSIPSKWDVPKTPIQYTFSSQKKWHQMLHKHNSSPFSDHASSSTSSKSQQLLSVWEMLVSKGECLGTYKGLRLETPIIAPSVAHPNFIYPKTKGIIRSRTMKPYYPFSHNLSQEQNLLNVQPISSTSPPGIRFRTGQALSPYGRPPIHTFVKKTREKFSKEHYSYTFISKYK